MFVANIPRRKIYETLLEFEEIILHIQFFVFKEEEFKENFQIKYLEKLEERYNFLKILIFMFFENKKYDSEDNFNLDFDMFFKKIDFIELKIYENKLLSKNFKSLIKNLNQLFENFFENKTSFMILNQIYSNCDFFNKEVVKILEKKLK